MLRRSLTIFVALVPALVLAAPDDEATYAWLSPQFTGGVEARPAGDDLVGELGARLFGLRALDRTWVQAFDASLGFRGGVLANQHPYTEFFGGRGSADFELGYRFIPANDWSPFLSGRANATLMVMGHPGQAIDDLILVNSSDGFGGVTLDANARVSGGLSLLRAGQSLLLTGFVQEAFRAPRVVSPAIAFTEFGLSMRSDGTRSFVIQLEALGGFGFTQTNTALNFTEQSFHLEVSGWLRKMFAGGFWFGLGVSYGRDSHHQFYTQAKTTYDTADAPVFSAMLAIGFAPWRKP